MWVHDHCCHVINRVINGLQVIVKAPVTHKGGFSTKPPTVMLHLSKEFVVGGDGPSRKHPDSLESTPHGNAGRLVSLAPLVCLVLHLACLLVAPLLCLLLHLAWLVYS